MLFEENIPEAKNPRFKEFDNRCQHIHDWITYLTKEVRDSWFDLDLEVRCIIINIAQACADREKWD